MAIYLFIFNMPSNIQGSGNHNTNYQHRQLSPKNHSSQLDQQNPLDLSYKPKQQEPLDLRYKSEQQANHAQEYYSDMAGVRFTDRDAVNESLINDTEIPLNTVINGINISDVEAVFAAIACNYDKESL